MRSSTVVSETAARLRAPAALSRTRSAVLLALAFILLTTEAGQGRAPAAPLNFFKNYFVTGDYRVYGVPIKGQPVVGGFTTMNITIPPLNQPGSVPAGAEPVAAYLYWSVVVAEQSPLSGIAGAQFDGNNIEQLAKLLNPIGASPCWSSGGAGGGGGGDANKKLFVNRADILRFFDDVDSNGNALINGTTHTVKLPNNSGGNVTPFTIGASIVLVYRTQTDPFRAIVFYDGGFTINQGTDTLTQPIQGFYDASHTNPAAKATFIIGDGQPNFYERLRYSDNLQTTPVNLAENSLNNGWDSPTYPLPMSTGATSATLTVDHGSEPSYDCLTGGAFIVSLEPEDTDGDGLLNRWETSTAGNDPFGQPLPDLLLMGADPCRKDLFVELGYFREPLGWDSETSAIQPPPGPHSHRPGEDDLVRTRAILNDVAVPFKNAPVANNYTGCTPPTGWTTGIKVHFDAGNIGQTGADEFIIPADKARGGEEIEEKACVPNPTAGITCQFLGYEGVVGWKVGFYYYKDAAVDPTTGAQLSVANEDACEPNCQRRRFDRNRKDIFHYFLFAHALGVPVNLCLLPNGLPDTECQENNPDFHIPRREGGAGDKPGGDAVVTTGLWASVSDFVMSSIITHELGHHLWRDHSGDPFVSFEPNCNPNYLSVMNYIFEYDGLKKNDGVPRIDFSRQALGSVNEDSLPAGLGTLAYRTAWYAPKSSVHQSLGTTVATRRCDGTLPGAGEEMIRIEGTGLNTSPPSGPTQGTIPIDWNGDLNTTNDFPNLSQDITFNGVTNNDTVPPPNPLKLLLGSDDWTPMANFGLRQIGGRRSLAGLSLDASKFDGSKFDGSKFDGSKFDGSKFDGSKFDGSKEADFETVTAYGHPAHSLKATWVGRNVVAEWKEPTAKQTGGISAYLLYRVDGLSVTVDNFKKKALVARTPFLTATDTRVTAGKPYTYFVIVEFGDGTTSAMSNWANPQ